MSGKALVSNKTFLLILSTITIVLLVLAVAPWVLLTIAALCLLTFIYDFFLKEEFEEVNREEFEEVNREEFEDENLEEFNSASLIVRIPRDADDFEEVCAEWMRQAGFPNAQRTPRGPDGGVDVISLSAVAQAKFTPGHKVSSKEIRDLVGAKVQNNKMNALFFHYGPGYTNDAVKAAEDTSVQLFQFDTESQRFFKIV